MKDRMRKNVGNNPILGNPSSTIMEIHDEVIRLQNEAAKDSNHWTNDGLRTYFEDVKHKLAKLNKLK